MLFAIDSNKSEALLKAFSEHIISSVEFIFVMCLFSVLRLCLYLFLNNSYYLRFPGKGVNRRPSALIAVRVR